MRSLRLICLLWLLVPAVWAQQIGSPYFSAHTNDPIDWRPWGEAALEEARRSGRPVLLSIGYSACYWCTVMHRESFLDLAVAERVNALTVPVLVDREERPDIDALYQEAAIHMGVQRGWPLTLFLDADGRPFAGGAYFPDQPRAGVPSFAQVLDAAATAWMGDRDALLAHAQETLQALRASISLPLDPDRVVRLQDHLLDVHDPFFGGFGVSVKHPRLPAVEALWRRYLRTGEDAFGEAVRLSLEQMSRGALFDHLGGGFFRYAVEPDWSTPHYEKMLDQNAQFVALLTEVWKETREPWLADRVERTIRFVMEDMRLGDGAFAAALSADVDGEEGTYYLWSEEQVRDVLGNGADAFLARYALPLPVPEGEARVYDAAWLEALRAARVSRPAPRRDEKRLAEWHGALIAALAEAGAAFGRPEWLEVAEATHELVLDRLWDGRRLLRGWDGDTAGGEAVLDDHAQMARAALTLYELTGRPQRLAEARALLLAAAAGFHEDDGGWRMARTPAAAGVPVVRAGRDRALASGAAVVVEQLARLYYLTGDVAARRIAEQSLPAFGEDVERRTLDHAGLLSAADTLAGAVQAVIVSGHGREVAKPLLQTVWGIALPGRAVQVIGDGAQLPGDHPAHGKRMIGNAPTAYVCVGTVCSLPVTDENELRHTLREMRTLRVGG